MAKQIVAPTINSEYGKNIQEVFGNIDSNFNVLANKGLVQGEAGSSVISLNVPWSIILEGSGVEGYEGYIIPSCEDDIKDAFYELIDIDPATVEDDPDPYGVDKAIEQLSESGYKVTVCFNPPATPSTEIDILSIIPHVFIDVDFRNNVTAERIDMSCVISKNSSWVCERSFPYLSYNNGTFYWVVNGEQTTIEASGPSGRDGKTGEFYICLTDNAITPISGTSQTYELSKIMTSEGFVNFSDYQGEILNNSPVIVFSTNSDSQFSPEDPDDPEQHLPGVSTYYIISTIYSGDNNYETKASNNNICYAYLVDTEVRNALFNSIKTIPYDGSTTGIIIPGYPIYNQGTSNPKNGYCIFAQYTDAADSTAHKFVLSYVNNIENPAQTVTNAGNFEINGSVKAGSGLQTTNPNEVAVGTYNNSHELNSDSSGTIFTVGVGTASNNRENAVEVLTGGEIYVKGIGNYNGNEDPTDSSDVLSLQDVVNSNPFVPGTYPNSAVLKGSEATATKPGAVAHGYKNGGTISASGYGAHAEGYAMTNNSISASGHGAHAEGCGTTASGDYSHAEGEKTAAAGVSSHAEGYHTIAGTTSHAEGYQTIAEGTASHAEGSSTTASGESSHAEGVSTTASGEGACAAGTQTIAQGNYSFACGDANMVTEIAGFAAGKYGVPGFMKKVNRGDTSCISETSTSYSQAGTYDDPVLFYIGCGTGSGTSGGVRRKNSFIITASGQVFVAYDQGGITATYTYLATGRDVNVCDWYLRL